MKLRISLIGAVLVVWITGCGDYDDNDSRDSYERDRGDERSASGTAIWTTRRARRS